MKQFVLVSLACLTLWGCKQSSHKEAPFKMIDQVALLTSSYTR